MELYDEDEKYAGRFHPRVPTSQTTPSLTPYVSPPRMMSDPYGPQGERNRLLPSSSFREEYVRVSLPNSNDPPSSSRERYVIYPPPTNEAPYRETSERARRIPSITMEAHTTTTTNEEEGLLQDLEQGRDPYAHYRRTPREKGLDSPSRYLEDLYSVQDMGLPILHLSSRINLLQKYGPLITRLQAGYPITYHRNIHSRLLMAFAKYFGISVLYVQNTQVILAYAYPLYEFKEGDIISLRPL